MKILLLSDTHGHIDHINNLIDVTQVDIAVHAGDFGFYDEGSYKQISKKELFLLISHSPYWKEYSVDKNSSRDELVSIVKKHNLLGQFQNYLNGNNSFKVPVYAVYGNHEDVNVIKRLKAQNQIKNLILLDENQVIDFKNINGENLKVFGLGGNFLTSKKLFEPPIAGAAGKVWATLHQFGVLYKNIEKKSQPSIFVTHVSPGKEPLLTRLALHYMPNIWVSGHMGPPIPCIWNQFTIRELTESMEWMDCLQEILQHLENRNISDEVALALEVLQRPVPKKDFWFKQMWNINLPDAKNGYVVLNYSNNVFSLEQTVGTLHIKQN